MFVWFSWGFQEVWEAIGEVESEDEQEEEVCEGEDNVKYFNLFFIFENVIIY